jgi:hypothetical protein
MYSGPGCSQGLHQGNVLGKERKMKGFPVLLRNGEMIYKYASGKIEVFRPDGSADHTAYPNGDVVWWGIYGDVFFKATAINPAIY